MYTINDKLTGPVMGVHIRSEITGRETQRLASRIEKRSAGWGRLRLLVVMDTYPNFNSAEAICEDLRFAKLSASCIARIAVVGTEAWKDTWIGLFGLFGGLEMAYFQKTEIESAWKWLTAASPAS